MRRKSIGVVALVMVAACEPVPLPDPVLSPEAEIPAQAVAMDGDEIIVDGPLPPVFYQCADGRRVSYSAVIGGVYVRIDDDPPPGRSLPQVFHPGLPGYAHEGEGIGWLINPDDSAEIADLAPGDSLLTVTRVPCTRVGG